MLLLCELLVQLPEVVSRVCAVATHLESLHVVARDAVLLPSVHSPGLAVLVTGLVPVVLIGSLVLPKLLSYFYV